MSTARSIEVALGRAAKLAGLLSATRRDDGGYSIDVAELERVYPLRAPTDAAHATDRAPDR
jgi:hypothetical protein